VFRKLLSALAMLTLCAAAYAGEEPAPGGETRPGGGARPGLGGMTRMAIYNDPVLSRLTLTEDQLKALDKLYAENMNKRRELGKEKLDAKERAAKVKELADELKKKIREVLTEEQQKKFDAGCQILADAEKALDEKVGPKPDRNVGRPERRPPPAAEDPKKPEPVKEEPK